MSLGSTGHRPVGYATPTAYKLLSEKDTTARSDIYSCTFLLVWLIGTILFGKDFAYISVGPLFITEMVLGVLIMNNFNRLRISDVFLIGVVLAYVVAGTLAHKSFTFAGKDISSTEVSRWGYDLVCIFVLMDEKGWKPTVALHCWFYGSICSDCI